MQFWDIHFNSRGGNNKIGREKITRFLGSNLNYRGKWEMVDWARQTSARCGQGQIGDATRFSGEKGTGKRQYLINFSLGAVTLITTGTYTGILTLSDDHSVLAITFSVCYFCIGQL